MARKKRLLDVALAQSKRDRMPVTTEEIEVAVAWLKREVNLSQVSAALNPGKPTTGSVLYRIAVCLRAAHDQGKIQVVQP